MKRVQWYANYILRSSSRHLRQTPRNKIRGINYLFPPAGIVNPLVMKSPVPFAFPSLEDSFVKRLCKFSLVPTIFLFFLRSFSSSRTRAVSIAVAAFLIPLFDDAVVFGVGVDVLLRAAVVVAGSGCWWCARLLAVEALPMMGSGSCAMESPVAFFLRFLEPGAFLREWVRP